MLEGSGAPDFRLPSADGSELGGADLRGKWCVLYFYPKDNTSGCTAEALEFTALKGEFEALGARVVGVSPDSTASHTKFIAKHNLGVTLLSDPEHGVLKAFDAWGKKKTYGKEYEGVIRSTALIDPEGVVRRVWPKAKSKGHAAEVLEALKSMV
ncbi:MAG: peroxiredoxin [Syntrophobacteraceae bacterium]